MKKLALVLILALMVSTMVTNVVTAEGTTDRQVLESPVEALEEEEVPDEGEDLRVFNKVFEGLGAKLEMAEFGSKSGWMARGYSTNRLFAEELDGKVFGAGDFMTCYLTYKEQAGKLPAGVLTVDSKFYFEWELAEELISAKIQVDEAVTVDGIRIDGLDFIPEGLEATQIFRIAKAKEIFASAEEVPYEFQGGVATRIVSRQLLQTFAEYAGIELSFADGTAKIGNRQIQSVSLRDQVFFEETEVLWAIGGEYGNLSIATEAIQKMAEALELHEGPFMVELTPEELIISFGADDKVTVPVGENDGKQVEFCFVLDALIVYGLY